MSTASRLPEELLRDILSYSISVDEEKFCAFSLSGYLDWKFTKYQAPLCRDAQKTRSRVALLLVCKQWLRIATPLLYEKVIVRDAAQTKAVADVLKANPAVGRAVKYLRLEGGMGKDLQTVAQYAPNIHTLWMSPHIRSSESITGLKKVIAQLQPRTAYVLIRGWSGQTNKTAVEVERLVIPCIAREWASLVSCPAHWDPRSAITVRLP